MKTLARIGTLVAVCALTAAGALRCARRPPVPPPGNAALFRHLEGDPPTLDPTVTNDEIGLRVEELLFRPLIGIDKARRYVPALATSWTVSPDGRVFEFRLDPAARWEDGTPVTSDDVAFTLDRIRDPKIPALAWKAGLAGLTGIEAPEPTRVVLRFASPYAQRLLALNLPIVARAAFAAKDADRKPFASGPYRLEAWEPNQRIVLARRADQNADAYPFGRIVFRVIPDNATRFRAGVRGELDEFRVSRDQRAEAERSAEFAAHNRLERVPLFSVVMLVWNCRNPVLADRRVRLALARAWPREETAKRLYPPEGARLDSGPYPAGAAENAPDVATPPYDPAAAAKLLDEAGFRPGPDGIRRKSGRRAQLEYLYLAGQPMYTNIGEILRESYRKVGVALELRPLDWAAYSQRFAAGEFEVAPYSNEFLPPNLDPYPYYHSSQAPPKGLNAGSYANREADASMEEAQRELDDARRLELYRKIHRLLADDPPGDFLWSTDQYWGISKRLAGVEVSPLGLFHFLPGPLGWRLAPAAK